MNGERRFTTVSFDWTNYYRVALAFGVLAFENLPKPFLCDANCGWSDIRAIIQGDDARTHLTLSMLRDASDAPSTAATVNVIKAARRLSEANEYSSRHLEMSLCELVEAAVDAGFPWSSVVRAVLLRGSPEAAVSCPKDLWRLLHEISDGAFPLRR